MVKAMRPAFLDEPELSPEQKDEKAQKYCEEAKSHPNLSLFYYNEALKLKPDYIPALFGKANLLTEIGDNKGAIECLEKLIAAKEDFVEAYLLLGMNKSALGDSMGCIKMCEKGIELNSEFAEAYNILGETLMEIGKYVEALKAYNTVLRLEPSHIFASGNKGYLLYLTGDPDGALKLYEEHLKISPNDFTVLIKKGVALQSKSKDKEALDCFQEATNLLFKGKLRGLIWKFQNFKLRLNQREVGLIHCLEEFLKIPEINSILKEDEIQELEIKKKALKTVIIEGFSKKPSEENAEMIKQLGDEIVRISKKTDELEADIKDAGVKELAMVKRGFKELQEKDEELFSYCKTFYWTTVNLMGAYRVASTGMVSNNYDYGTSCSENLLYEGVKKVTSVVADISQGVPFLGGLVSMFNSIIDKIVDCVKENAFENKVNAINKIIQCKIGTEDEISVNICKVALVITQAREKNILYPELSEAPSSQLSKGIKWLENQINNIKEKVLPSIDLHDPNSWGATLALQDVSLVIAYLTKNSDAVVSRKDPIEKQLEAIIKFNGLTQVLAELNEIDIQVKGKKEKRNGRCTIF